MGGSVTPRLWLGTPWILGVTLDLQAGQSLPFLESTCSITRSTRRKQWRIA